MDQATTQSITDEAARKAVVQMREFHLDDLKAFREYSDIKFESLERKIDGICERVDTLSHRVENALSTLLQEFKEELKKYALSKSK